MHPVPLRRKLAFCWAIFRLATRGVFLGVASAVFAWIAITRIVRGYYLSAAGAAAIAALFASIFFVRAVILRYHIRRGMGVELRKRNCCPHCMYDLRASPFRCPECGWLLPMSNIEV